jgi:nudix-type nucleoside diphosphatase (YffH/AdpP family)
VLTLVRQFRLPPHLQGDEGYLLEVCAGLLDGDTPETCARKEAMEETGIAPSSLAHAFDLYASPGSLSEKTHCFIGFYAQVDRTGPGGGLGHEGEDIETIEIGFAQALSLIETGAIRDSKTVALIQYAALKGLLA